MSLALTTTYENCYFRRSIRSLNETRGKPIRILLSASLLPSICFDTQRPAGLLQETSWALSAPREQGRVAQTGARARGEP
jgi:hypothetical protein